MSRVQYDKQMQMKVAKSWEQEFTCLKHFKSGSFVKRNGPLIVGFCLAGKNTDFRYQPLVYFHCLAVEMPAISTSFPNSLIDNRGRTATYPVSSFEVDKLELLNEIKCTFPFLDKEEFTFNDFIKSIVAYQKSPMNMPYQSRIFYDTLLVAAYLDLEDYVNEGISEFAKIMSSWPANVRLWPVDIGSSIDSWIQQVTADCEKVKIKNTVEAEVIKHKLHNIWDMGILSSEDPLKLWELL